MGDIESNDMKLQVFVDAANSNSNSHLVTVPPGVLPSDVLVSSPVLHGEDSPILGGGSGGGSGGMSGGDNFAEYGGVDPSMDPELALALRVSMEEERARQEAQQRKAAEEAAAAEAASQSQTVTNDAQQKDGESEVPPPAPAVSPPRPSASTSNTVVPASEPTAPAPAPAAPAPASSLPFMDPTFVNSLLSGLPGVDPNDPKIQAAMAQMQKKDGESKDTEEKKEDK